MHPIDQRAPDTMVVGSVKFVARVDVAASPLGEEMALLDLETGDYFTLNETGAFLWRTLESPQSRDELLLALLGEFDGDPATMGGELDSYLAGLTGAGLLATVDG